MVKVFALTKRNSKSHFETKKTFLISLLAFEQHFFILFLFKTGL
jgi:hypothetical protein